MSFLARIEVSRHTKPDGVGDAVGPGVGDAVGPGVGVGVGVEAGVTTLSSSAAGESSSPQPLKAAKLKRGIKRNRK